LGKPGSDTNRCGVSGRKGRKEPKTNWGEEEASTEPAKVESVGVSARKKGPAKTG